MKNKNDKKFNWLRHRKINWLWFGLSILFSIVFGWLTTHFFADDSKQFLGQLINNSLAFSAFPSLLISTLVIKNLSEVRDQIKLEEKNQKFFDRRDTQEFSRFKSDYENNFKIDCDKLQDDLEKIIIGRAGSSREFKNRIKENSYRCFKNLELYTYVDTRIGLRELELDNVESYAEQYEFKSDNFVSLKDDLEKLNNEVENMISDVQFCKGLDISLGKFKQFAEFLINESDSKGGQTQTGVQEDVAKEDGGFYE